MGEQWLWGWIYIRPGGLLDEEYACNDMLETYSCDTQQENMAAAWHGSHILSLDDDELDDVFESASSTASKKESQECSMMSDATSDYVVSTPLLYWFDLFSVVDWNRCCS